MQLITFAITVPKGSCTLVLFLTVLSLPRSTKRDVMAALFPEVAHAEFVRRELECIIGFDGEEI